MSVTPELQSALSSLDAAAVAIRQALTPQGRLSVEDEAIADLAFTTVYERAKKAIEGFRTASAAAKLGAGWDDMLEVVSEVNKGNFTGPALKRLCLTEEGEIRARWRGEVKDRLANVMKNQSLDSTKQLSPLTVNEEIPGQVRGEEPTACSPSA